MQEKTPLNYQFLDWITLSIKGVIQSMIDEEPDKIPTLISVNEMLNQCGVKSPVEVSAIIGEYLVEKVYDDVKKCF